MNCRTTRRLIDLLVGHDLSATEEAAVQKHLAECDDCAREFERDQQCQSALGVLRDSGALCDSGLGREARPAAGRSVEARIRTRLAGPPQMSFWPGPLRWRDVAKFVTLVAVCLVLAVAPQWRAERWGTTPAVIPVTFHREAGTEPGARPTLPPGPYQQIYSDPTWKRLSSSTAKQHVDAGSF